jgi:hypothetical protein
VPSASRHILRACLLAICGLLLVGGVSGCTTTQETAAQKQAESKRILERRYHEHARKQRSNSHDHGSNEQ